MAAKPLQLTTVIQSSFGKPDDPDYIFDIVANGDKSVMAVSLSTNVIKLYNPETGEFKGDLSGHTSTISSINFPDPSSPQLLFSSSADSTIRVWDIRAGKEVLAFRAPKQSDELWSFSVGGSPANLIAGGGDKQVYIWDWRSKMLSKTYSEFHTEAVTQVQFHPLKKEQLITISVDGLLNMIDTKQPFEEEECSEYTINIGTSLSKFGFCGKENEMVWIMTHIETLSLFNLEDQQEVAAFGDTRTKASYSWNLQSVDYLINCHFSPATDSIWLAAGNNNGSVGYFPISYTKSSNSSTPGPGVIGDVGAVLKGGHEGVVRSICLNQNLDPQQSLFCWTGGEDGRLCSWSQNGSTERSHAWVSSKLVMRKSNSSRQKHSPY